jgi:2'-5' RNA ligase
VADRHYIALALPPEAVAELQGWQSVISEHATHPMSSIRPERMHLTLVFLGDIEPTQVEIAERAVDRAFSGVGPLQLAAGPLERFGGGQVLACTVEGPDFDRLREARAELAVRLHRGGAMDVEDRSWRPHITLMRAKHPMRDVPQIAPARPISIVGTSVELVASLSAPGGHEYHVVHRVSLG